MIWNNNLNSNNLFSVATGDGWATRGQLTLDKRNKNAVKSYSKLDLNETANDVKSRRAGVVLIVFSVDVEKLKKCLIRELSQ